MATKKSPGKGSAKKSSAKRGATKSTTRYQAAPSPFSSERELIVVAKSDAGLRAMSMGTEVASMSGTTVASLNSLLQSSGATLVPIFGNEDRVEMMMAARSTEAAMADVAPPEGLANLSSFYRVAASEEQLDKLADKLLNLDMVDAAFIKPAPEPPVLFQEAVEPPSLQEAPPSSPSFTTRQTYLDAAPGGIDARFAWTRPGGKGQGVRVIDIEGAWRFGHEDLTQNQGGVIGGTQSTDIGWRNHGTAVAGVFSGDENSFGITGICPLANLRAISIFGTGQGSAKAITDAANALSPGDIILIELHAPGPRFNFQTVNGQQGYIAMEFWPDNFAAIVYATSVRGVIVVEAAGNGAENYDDPLYNNRPSGFPASWRNPFNLSNPQSGAILVGAGAPPPGTHGRNHGADRSRLDFSNFGARVDVQGWGREVTTTGYGDLQGGSNEDLWYTDVFSGTSSASPVIVGTVGCMQGGLRGAGKPLLTPATARNILRTTGSPQQNEPGRPATQRIGNRPNLKQAFQQLGIAASKNIIKEVTKDKLEKLEHKEVKEKIEIIEVKNFVRETVNPGFGPGSAQSSGGDLESRVANLEQTLSHFISGELRPDLQSSALNQEEDLTAISQRLEKEANDAKSVKDQKDVEKPRET